MLNNVYRLTSVQQIERVTESFDIREKGKVIVRPTLMSICRADERYYTGTRDAKILAERLPMALIHEAVGEVVRDNTGRYEPGTKVALIPTHANHHDDLVSDNYLDTSKFHSSTMDGFMSEFVLLNPSELVEIPESAQSEMNGFIEVISVAVQAVRRLQETMIDRAKTIGIWGDGNVAYITAVVVQALFPQSELLVFGKHREKLDYISFADTYLIDQIPKNLRIDQGIEAVGGRGSEDALNQMIEHINSRGTIVLAGVSEKPVSVNTRLVLEKGLSLAGTTRSTREDFEMAINLLTKNDTILERFEMMVQNIKHITNVSDITEAFDEDLNMNWGKTIMEWDM